MNARILALASVVALSLAGAGLPALAQAPAPAKKTKEEKQEARKEAREKSEAQFKTADTNADGGLSRQEITQSKHKFPLIDKNFDAMDTNKDGKVSIAERDAWVKAKGAEKKKKQ